MHAIRELLADTATGWMEHQAPALAAALAYYTAFAIAPLLFIATAIAAFFHIDAGDLLATEVGRLLPANGVDALNLLLEGIRNGQHGGVASTVISVTALLMGAAGVFGQLQDALNTIWAVTPAKRRPPLWANIRQRLLSFSMMLGAAFLLLVSLLASTLLASVVNQLHARLEGFELMWQLLNVACALSLSTLIFAMIFKIVPDAPVGWRDVWLGSLLTSALFTCGQLALARYFGTPGPLSIYGVFGSLIVLLLWVYYSAQILFFGAEFTRAFACRYGTRKYELL